jgi:uncharacterized protein YjiS (DUF1127 family)
MTIQTSFSVSTKAELNRASEPSMRSAAMGQARSYPLRLLDTLRVWNECSRQRRVFRLLAERHGHLLEDIGLSQDETLREAAKPFWRR